ncbi:alpha/beta-type small acid-soluble spore protein [Brevibacillus dissolubilis]|uniref:alpha/beta-type small acid-soluble spore protein n=1 Tax=Brevibacillus dissolubilis TaxID=1844116 RepID=UPI001C3F467C|nr:alpha/beta-type small acid-soluble spore protein [Brevibacillus dissolubilis]
MSRNHLVVPQAEDAMNRLKMETAHELGLDDDIEQRGWGEMTTREVGKIGGNMVKKMIAYAEKHMAEDPNQSLE